MTRRLMLAFVAVVAAALLLAGAGSVVLAGVADRRDARADLEKQVLDAAGILRFTGVNAPSAVPALKNSLQVDGVAVVPVTSSSVTAEGVTLSTDDLLALRGGKAWSRVDGSLIIAAAGVARRPVPTIVVVTKRVPLLEKRLTGWFLLASLVALALAALTGRWLARRVLRPLQATQDTTHRIAAGDFDARVDVPAGTDELSDLAASVNAMAAALGRSRDLDRNFLLSISHDLRTPLTSIRGWAEAIADGTAPDAATAAGVITGEAARLGRLVEDLLELAKLDSRQFPLRPVPVDVGEEVERAVTPFGPGLAEHDVRLQVVAPRGIVADLDPDRLAQVVANLVENAGKYASSAVSVTVAASADGAAIDVVDDGPGIAAAERERVFERLYAGRPAGRGAVASGLGLAIVAELVAAMGGRVQCEAGVGGGTVMSVRLPAATPSERGLPTLRA